jgi:hypothetical protein
MFMRILDALAPYYLLHIIIDGVQANAFIAGRLGKFAADQRAKGRNLVIVNAWRISRRDFLALQSATPHKS